MDVEEASCNFAWAACVTIVLCCFIVNATSCSKEDARLRAGYGPTPAGLKPEK